MSDDAFLRQAIALGAAARGITAPNPNVGCLIVDPDGQATLGRGATQAGGRPHAEAVALVEAGPGARGATLFTSLEPCVHRSDRGPACADLILQAGISRVVAALIDPDPRTCGLGIARLRGAGLAVAAAAAEAVNAGFFSRMRHGRPHVTLKLALSIDGKIALASGESKWITGTDARAHVHLERSRADMILVGRGTLLADRPSLDVRLPGLEHRSPRRALLTLHDVNDLLVEGGSATATAFLAADLVDRILLYRAPILIGEGKSSVGYIGLDAIGDAHERWVPAGGQQLGIDRLEIYDRLR